MSSNAHKISIVEKGDYLLVTFPPFESLVRRKQQLTALYDAIDQHPSRRVLIDSRATRKQVPIVELYDLCIYLVSKFGNLNPKMAVVISPEAAYPDRFGENVVRNRGLDAIRFIDDESEALNWLLSRKSG